MTLFCDRSVAAFRLGRGFTLLELIVVLSLLAILSAAVVPLYGQSMSAIQLRDARNDFVALLSFVQERAVTDSREYRVYIDSETHSYWVGYHAATEEEEKVFKDVAAEYGRERFLPEFLELDRIKAPEDRELNVHYIGCYPNGACDRVEVTFTDTRTWGRQFSVATEGVMGKISVETQE